jgi:hypothetical protein
MTRAKLTLAVAEGGILGLTAVSFVLSYSAQRHLAAIHGYTAWEAALWPLLPDLLALSTTMIALTLAARGRGPTGEAWFMAGLSAVVTIGGNILSVGDDPIGIGLHAFTAVAMIGAWHLFFRTVEATTPAITPTFTSSPSDHPHGQIGHESGQTPPSLEGYQPVLLAPPTPARSSTRTNLATVTLAATTLEANGHPVTAEALAKALGVSLRSARRWLALIRQNGTVGRQSPTPEDGP